MRVRIVTQDVKDPFEYIGSHPSADVPECAVPLSKLSRQLAPRCMPPHNPKRSFKEKPSIVYSPTQRRCPART